MDCKIQLFRRPRTTALLPPPVRTAEPQSLLCGGAIITDIPFAMPAVCRTHVCLSFNACFDRTDRTFCAGLYYKLHGRDRPVAMKKSIIKRRKRVVPALRDQSPSAGSANDSSASPEAVHVGLAHAIDDHRHEQANSYAASANGQISPHMYPASRTAAPPPVDFTNYGSSGVLSLPHHPPPPHQHQQHHAFNGTRPAQNEPLPGGSQALPLTNHASNPKKRSLPDTDEHHPNVPTPTHLPPINPAGASSTSNPARLSSISSLLNHADRPREDSRIDPALTAHSAVQQQRQQQHQTPLRSFSPSGLSSSASPTLGFAQPHASNPAESEQLKAERRAQLQREAENMREALRAKERELAELGLS